MQALEQLAVASRALPALRPRFLNLGAFGLSMSELGDIESSSMCLGSHSSNTDMKSCHNSNASSSPAPFVAAGRDPRHIDSDTLLHNSLFDGPQASKFKKRGRRAGKARDAPTTCSSGCTSIIE